MPRGRHRHSPPLHKLMPPSAVAGAAVVCAAAAWIPGELVVVRLLAVAASAAAVTGAVLMRGWDRSAGRQVAELTRARTADQWKAEERLAELEADLEESRALRIRLDAKLRAKRVELAGLRGEHADLLRRYATAETERASALEGQRVLAQAGAEAPKELPAAGSTPTPEAYRRAAQALRDLPRNAAAQQARRTAEAARARDLAERAAQAEEPRGRHAAEHAHPPGQDAPAALAPAATAKALPPAAPAQDRTPAVPAASAIAPYAARRPAPRTEGGFDFFGTQAGTQTGTHKAAIEAVQDTDLADVVGEEVLEEARAADALPAQGPALTPVPASAAVGPRPERADEPAQEPAEEEPVVSRSSAAGPIGQVIDLTAHDETEQLDLAELRGAVNQ
ncbi:hypothetical protein HHL19_28245 [Streptomyces sp. R302]|uniref:hypothetical protein n=1 Tax=unclassified Streptomyces TaxID=2593676 RepID=UPI00145FABAE|nr:MULTISPECIES: hypothetical protein [unclassified Streptomyces]NML52095.1 hypothetical protein [Streptomyces sp. R301]NML82439.1 hypothetical protein [Streptomyces sp. R302]